MNKDFLSRNFEKNEIKLFFDENSVQKNNGSMLFSYEYFIKL